MSSAADILNQYWKFSKFRPLQEEIINSVLAKQDTLALLPTGGGKSICFQVPALMNDGLCLVVSPLIALMKDQVENLRKKGITAFAIYSGMTRKEVISTFKLAGESNCKFLYVSPERLESSLFSDYLPTLPINLIAVDEAHCISQWGYDFRPPYLRIADTRLLIPRVPILALTASATPDVQADICEKLKLKKPTIFRQSFARANLSYSVFKPEVKLVRIREILKAVPGSGIVYCKSRRRTKEIAAELNLEGISADFYHAGLSADERSEKQEAWIANKTRIIVSTNAFGMGIDKPDVRTVIHADVPDCLENYYQEAGRAGRDEKKAYAVLLYQDKDIQELESQAEKKFPTAATVLKTYQAVANYVQQPSGLGEGNYFDFDLNDFVSRFKLDLFETISSLKILEQEEWLAFNEQVFVPARATFSCTKEMLYEFERTHPQLEEFVKTLLRNYEGIFDQLVAIYEKSLAWLVKISPDQVKINLKQLHAVGIIRYEPQKDKPQLYFIRNRIPAEEIRLDHAAHAARKSRYFKRLESLTHYTTGNDICRSVIIGLYFGDEQPNPCGVCDICLKKKQQPLSAENFEAIKKKIMKMLAANSLPTKSLLDQLYDVRKENAWEVLNFLQAEEQVSIDSNGIISAV